MSKHTPGPWRSENRFGHSSAERPVITADGIDRIAVISGSNGQDAMRANAHLIAAAPDLLAALKALVEQIPAVDDGTLAHEWMKAKDAIAKAEGTD